MGEYLRLLKKESWDLEIVAVGRDRGMNVQFHLKGVKGDKCDCNSFRTTCL